MELVYNYFSSILGGWMAGSTENKVKLSPTKLNWSWDWAWQYKHEKERMKGKKLENPKNIYNGIEGCLINS